MHWCSPRSREKQHGNVMWKLESGLVVGHPISKICMKLVNAHESHIKRTSMKFGFIFPKKNVKFGKMIKSVLFKVCSVAFYTFPPSLGQFVNNMPVKIFSFCCELFTRHFFTSSYESKRCQQVREVVDSNKW